MLVAFFYRVPVMPAKPTRTLANRKIPKQDRDKLRFEAWLNDFDARQA